MSSRSIKLLLLWTISHKALLDITPALTDLKPSDANFYGRPLRNEIEIGYETRNLKYAVLSSL